MITGRFLARRITSLPRFNSPQPQSIRSLAIFRSISSLVVAVGAFSCSGTTISLTYRQQPKQELWENQSTIGATRPAPAVGDWATPSTRGRSGFFILKETTMKAIRLGNSDLFVT